jgi:hypothetical protein
LAGAVVSVEVHGTLLGYFWHDSTTNQNWGVRWARPRTGDDVISARSVEQEWSGRFNAIGLKDGISGRMEYFRLRTVIACSYKPVRLSLTAPTGFCSRATNPGLCRSGAACPVRDHGSCAWISRVPGSG